MKKCLTILMVMLMLPIYSLADELTPELEDNSSTSLMNEEVDNQEIQDDEVITSDGDVIENVAPEAEVQGEQQAPKANQEVKTVTVGKLPDISYQDSIALYKGNRQQRTPLGVVLPANTTINIRSVDPSSVKGDFSLSFFNNDRNTEFSYTLKNDGNWYSVTTKDSVSVPFVRDVTSNNDVNLEYSIHGEYKELPIYNIGDNESDFILSWADSKADYGFLNLERVQMLVPYKDFQPLQTNTFGSITNMSVYYTNMLNDYDMMSGLENNCGNKYDEARYTKYFIKANKNGWGLAYYMTDHTGFNGDTIRDYFNRGWMVTHELGHGYEYGISREIGLSEVYNNILSHFYQMKTNEPGDSSWLYQNNRLARDKEMEDIRHAGNVNFFDFDYQRKLYTFVHVLEYTGKEDLGYFNKMYRRLIDNSELAAYWNEPNDRLVVLLSYATGYNLYDYFYNYGLKATTKAKDFLASSNLKTLVYLHDIADDELATQIAKEQNLESMYSLIDQDVLNKYIDTTGSINVNINNDKLIGKKIIIKQNGNEISSQNIDSLKTYNFNNIKLGYYDVYIAGDEFSDYGIVNQAQLTKNNTNVEIVPELNTISNKQTIHLKGLGDAVFASIEYNKDNNQIIINEMNCQPHSYFSDAYVTVEIVSNTRTSKFRKEYIGNQTYNDKNQVIDITNGDQLIITHKEPSRIDFQEDNTKLYDNYSKVNVMAFDLGENYLVQEGIDIDQIIINRIDTYADFLKRQILKDDVTNYDKYNYFRTSLLHEINNLDETSAKTYLEKYADILNYKDQYQINIADDIKNGKVEASQVSAKSGQSIDLTITSNIGYELDKLSVVDQNNKEITITDNSFIMPDSDVVINASFKPITYQINTEVSNAHIEVTGNPHFGELITIKPTIDEGYELVSIEVVDEDGNQIELTNNQFSMPASNVVIKLTTKEVDNSTPNEDQPKPPVEDVPQQNEQTPDQGTNVVVEAGEESKEADSKPQEVINQIKTGISNNLEIIVSIIGLCLVLLFINRYHQKQ